MPDVYADIVPVNDERTEFPPRQAGLILQLMFWPFLVYPWQANLQTAICLSGGGTRAMVAAIGALRGLEYLNLLARTDLLVSVSGGTWTAGPFMLPTQSEFCFCSFYLRFFRSLFPVEGSSV